MSKYKEIKIPHGQRKLMMSYFNATYPTLRAALRFKTNSMKAAMMRKYALDHGGVLLSSDFMEESNNNK